MDEIINDKDKLAQIIDRAAQNLGEDDGNTEVDRVMYERIVNRSLPDGSRAQDVNQNVDEVIKAVSDNRSQ